MKKSLLFRGPYLICFVGNPGSGKGTQATRLSQILQIPLLVAGDAFRTESARDTPLGRTIRSRLEQGKEMTLEQWRAVIWQALRTLDATKGLLIDGVLRLPEQLPLVRSMAHQLGLMELVVIHLVVPVEQLIQRLLQRGRQDDQPQIIRQRLAWSVTATNELVDLVAKDHELITVDGTAPPHVVREGIVKELLSLRNPVFAQ